MSDEELLNSVPPSTTPEDTPGGNFEDVQSEDGGETPSAEEGEQSEPDDSTEGVESAGNDTENETSEGEEVPTETDDQANAEATDPETVETPNQEVQLTESEQLAKLFQPFKANGKEISIKSVDEAITLMQKGIGYSKKMEGIKGHLGIVKMLENNNLLDTDKLSFLIDLDNKKPEAIAKFIKDSGLDPLDIDVDQADQYKQTSYAVSPKEVELDNVLDDLRDTPSYSKMLSVVGSEWDTTSRDIVYQNPQVLKVINNHVESGIYDLIDAELTRQSALGNLTGMSSIDAYQFVGDKMEAEGKFNHLFQPKPSNPLERAAAKLAEQANTNKQPTVDKRKAAAVPKNSAPVAPAKKDLSKMSDEEYLKYFEEQLANSN